MRRTARSNSGEGFSGPSRKEVKPMDDGIRERSTGEVRPNRQRVAHSLTVLVTEFHEVFPETSVEYSRYDGRNTALDVTFDCSMIDTPEQIVLAQVMELVSHDPRIEYVMPGNDQYVVGLFSNPRTQDSREPFGFAGAWEALTEEDEDVIVGSPFFGGGQSGADNYDWAGGSL